MPRKPVIPKQEQTILQLLISKEKKRQFEELCAEEGTTMSDAIRSFINSKLQRAKPKSVLSATFRAIEESHKSAK